MCFRSKREIKIFLDKQKRKEFVTSSPYLQEMFKGMLQGEMKEY